MRGGNGSLVKWRLAERSHAIGALLAESPLLLVGGCIFVVLLVFARQDGGYAPTVWLPGALFVLGLLVVVYVCGASAIRERPLIASAVLCFAAFTMWNYLTILWAQERGLALDGANRTLLYFCIFTVLVSRGWSARGTAILIGGYAVGVAVLIGIYIERATAGGDPAAYFLAGRLASPFDYANAQAALVLAAFWPAMLFASRREVPPVVRGILLATAGLLFDAAILSESRSTVAAVPVALLVYVLIVPNRLRAVLVFVPLAAVGGLSAPALLHVYLAVFRGEHVSGTLLDARVTIARGVVALFFVGTLVGLVDRAVVVPARLVRIASVSAGVVAALVLAVAGVGAIAVYGDPVHGLKVGWRHFTSNRDDYGRVHLLSGLGSNRYDIWRVATLQFLRHPLGGVGSDNYGAGYLRDRHTTEEPLYPHSIELRIPSETGLVGVILFTGFLGSGLVALRRTRMRSSDASRAAVAAAAMVFVYWLVHGSVDWFWEIPALGGPAVAAFALAIRTGEQSGSKHTSTPGRRRVILALVVGLLAAASLGSTWIAAKETALAASGWPASPAQAFDRLAVARLANPLSDAPDVTAAVIADRIGDRVREYASFERALRRNPVNWYAHLELGVLDALAGRQAAALDHLAVAVRLDPRDPVVRDVRDRIRRGETPDPAQINRAFVARASDLQK